MRGTIESPETEAQTRTTPSLADRVAAARARLDEHVREMIDWHFSPETGCPFWLDFAKRLDFNPREAIQGYADLKLLGHFEDGWLRGGPVREAAATGVPLRRIT